MWIFSHNKIWLTDILELLSCLSLMFHKCAIAIVDYIALEAAVSAFRLPYMLPLARP